MQTYQMVGSRGEVVRVSVEETRASRKITVRVCLGEDDWDADKGVSLRWWTLRGSGGEVEVGEHMAEASESTKLAGNALVTPLVPSEDGSHVATLAVPLGDHPFSRFGFNPTYVHGGRPVLSRPEDHASFGVPLGFFPGTPYPLGVHRDGDWANFTVLSRACAPPRLRLFATASEAGDGVGGSVGSPDLELELDPTLNRTGDVWHCSLAVPAGVNAYAITLPSAGSAAEMGYAVEGEIVADPFGDDVARARVAEEGRLCTVSLLPARGGGGEDDGDFEEGWQEDGPLRHSLSKAVVLEMDLRRGEGEIEGERGGEVDQEGVFEAVRVAAEEVEDSGVTALAVRGLLSEETLTSAAAAGPGAGLGSLELKRLVMALHRMDLELLVQLDCLKIQEVLRASHLNEGLACQCLREACRFLVSEYHLDGIIFLHAEKLAHGDGGMVLDRPPLVEDLCSDPALAATKLVAVPFGDHLLPRGGVRGFPHWGRWAECNGRFVSDMRDLYSGEEETGCADLAKVSMRLAGSADLFQGWENGSFHLHAERPPYHGLNAASTVGGLPLSQELLEEGWALEERESIRWALITSVFVSQGVPMVRLVDLSSESWAEDLALISKLSSFRECYFDLIQKSSFNDLKDTRWHGVDAAEEPAWGPPAPVVSSGLPLEPAPVAEPGVAGADGRGRFIGMSLWSSSEMDAVYAGFNGNDADVNVTLPPPQIGHKWFVLLDSGRMELSLTNEHARAGVEYLVKAKSSILLVMQRPKNSE